MLRKTLPTSLLVKQTAYRLANGTSSRRFVTQAQWLEVERKFLVTPASVAFLHAGIAEFKQYENLGKKTTHDKYYDQDGQLFAKGIYIRRRNGTWEAKIRTGGDFINSSFREIEGSEIVRSAILWGLALPSASSLSIEELLSPCAEFVTERDSWRLDGRFQVDVDITDFGHTVGEVELTREIRSMHQTELERNEQEDMFRAEMDRDIISFMRSYPEAFPQGRPVGKLSAYFELHRK